jgi:hypothetical protein
LPPPQPSHILPDAHQTSGTIIVYIETQVVDRRWSEEVLPPLCQEHWTPFLIAQTAADDADDRTDQEGSERQPLFEKHVVGV